MNIKTFNINKRINVLSIIIIIIFLILIINLIYIICFKSNFYQKKLLELTNVTIYGESAPRGRIYDRNYNLLVDNDKVPVIYYKKQANITSKEEIELAYSLIDLIELPYEKLLTRNLKEFYLVIYKEECNEKIAKEEWDKLKKRI